MNATGSNSGVSGNDSNITITSKTKPHGHSARLQSVIGKQSSCVRKMSTMPEEEDGSDDTDPDVIRIGHQRYDHRQHQDVDSDSPSEEKGRLLNPIDSTRKITIVPANSSNVPCNGIKKSIPKSDNLYEDQERSYTRLQQTRPYDQVGQLEFKLNRDVLPGVPRTIRGLDHYVGRHRGSSFRSMKPNSTMDEQSQHQYHHQSPSWASIVFSDGNGQTQPRPFPDTVSIRSLASIGMGSSDGRKLTIRRVPTSPSELLNMVHPPL